MRQFSAAWPCGNGAGTVRGTESGEEVDEPMDGPGFEPVGQAGEATPESGIEGRQGTGSVKRIAEPEPLSVCWIIECEDGRVGHVSTPEARGCSHFC